jgi:hypothetical protein
MAMPELAGLLTPNSKAIEVDVLGNAFLSHNSGVPTIVDRLLVHDPVNRFFLP